MSSFEISGTVVKIDHLTSSKGNAYAVFQVKDEIGKTFELSLFGDSMGFLEKLKLGTPTTIKGMLSSRDFTDKNGKTRYGIELRPQWVEISGAAAPKKMASKSLDDEFSDIPF